MNCADNRSVGRRILAFVRARDHRIFLTFGGTNERPGRGHRMGNEGWARRAAALLLVSLSGSISRLSSNSDL